MRQGQQRDPDKAWGSYTQKEADSYFEKLGLKCVSKEQYRRWFILAERAGSKCRTLEAFCSDCTKPYETRMKACGNCVKPEAAK